MVILLGEKLEYSVRPTNNIILVLYSISIILIGPTSFLYNNWKGWTEYILNPVKVANAIQLY